MLQQGSFELSKVLACFSMELIDSFLIVIFYLLFIFSILTKNYKNKNLVNKIISYEKDQIKYHLNNLFIYNRMNKLFELFSLIFIAANCLSVEHEIKNLRHFYLMSSSLEEAH